MTPTDRTAWRQAFQTTTVPAIVAALAKLEPDAGWTLEPTEGRYPNPAIRNASGERFWLGVDDYKHRVTVHSTYGPMPDGRLWIPRDRVRDAVDPSPTISADKAPDQIARDIARRFLPDYRKYLALYRSDVAAAIAFRNETASLFDELISLGNGWIKPDQRTDSRTAECTARLYNAPGISYGDLRVSGSHVRIELSVTPEFAKRFATLLATFAEADDQTAAEAL
jgi:hypothetical protein